MIEPIRPSEVTDWIRCPRLWWLRDQGWRPFDTQWTPERLLGTAVHVGLAAWWASLSLLQGSYSTPGHRLLAEDAIKDTMISQWPPNAPAEFSREGLEAQALKTLDAVLKWIAKHMSDAKPVMVEQSLGADGHATPDLVTREQADIYPDTDGILVVTDWKISANLPVDRIQYRLQDLEKTHQFLHYAWAVGEHLKEPVRLFRKVVIAAGPQIRVKDGTFTPTPESLAAWHADAQVKWDLMHKMRDGTVYPWRNEDGCLKYGEKWRCWAYDGCWTAHGDPERMRQFLMKGESR